MFSLKVVDTDEFLDMPMSSQHLYMNLALRADDDGFVGNPKKICRLANCTDDDFKVLIAKKFIIPFQSGVCVIRHWRIHNYIQSDRHTPTEYQEELGSLKIADGKYHPNVDNIRTLTTAKSLDNSQNVSKMDTQVRLGQGRRGKDKINKTTQIVAASGDGNKDIPEIIFLFKNVNPSYKVLFGRKGQRDAVARLLKQWPRPRLDKIVMYLEQTNGKKYYPTITTPIQLEEKLGMLIAEIQRERSKTEKGGVMF